MSAVIHVQFQPRPHRDPHFHIRAKFGDPHFHAQAQPPELPIFDFAMAHINILVGLPTMMWGECPLPRGRGGGPGWRRLSINL